MPRRTPSARAAGLQASTMPFSNTATAVPAGCSAIEAMTGQSGHQMTIVRVN
jgi:hypothetical protein